MSMLPFLQPKKMASVIVSSRKSDGSKGPEKEEGEHDPGFMSASEDLISAIHAKDAKGVADALKAAYEMRTESQDDLFNSTQDSGE